jgi:hypothetical protein
MSIISRRSTRIVLAFFATLLITFILSTRPTNLPPKVYANEWFEFSYPSQSSIEESANGGGMVVSVTDRTTGNELEIGFPVKGPLSELLGRRFYGYEGWTELGRSSRIAGNENMIVVHYRDPKNGTIGDTLIVGKKDSDEYATINYLESDPMFGAVVGTFKLR